MNHFACSEDILHGLMLLLGNWGGDDGDFVEKFAFVTASCCSPPSNRETVSGDFATAMRQ